jgi:hypothetical protein
LGKIAFSLSGHSQALFPKEIGFPLAAGRPAGEAAASPARDHQTPVFAGDNAFSAVTFCKEMMRVMAAWFDVASLYIFARSAFSCVRDAPSR